jgi:hypothetical protein
VTDEAIPRLPTVVDGNWNSCATLNHRSSLARSMH